MLLRRTRHAVVGEYVKSSGRARAKSTSYISTGVEWMRLYDRLLSYFVVTSGEVLHARSVTQATPGM